MQEPDLHIKRFQQGDNLSFKTIFDGQFKNLCLFINKFINDLPIAEDIAQETFITLWNHREEMDSSSHIKSFLYLTARNAAIDHLKHEKIKIAYSEKALYELETTENFIHFIIEEEVEQILQATEERLPLQCRRIFTLSMQGKSVEEIATLLDISINTVKTQKKIAYRQLKQHITALNAIIIALKI